MRAGAASRKLKIRSNEPAKLPSNGDFRQKQDSVNGKIKRQYLRNNNFSISRTKTFIDVDYKTETPLNCPLKLNSKNNYCLHNSSSLSYLEAYALLNRTNQLNCTASERQLTNTCLQTQLINSEVELKDIRAPPVTFALEPVDHLNSYTKSLSEKQNRDRLLAKVASSADAFVAAGAAAKLGGEKLTEAKKIYYRKAFGLMFFGGLLFAIGIVFSALYFTSGDKAMLVGGPVCLSVGLLLEICSIVWIPIIQTKLKRQQQLMSRTFSL